MDFATSNPDSTFNLSATRYELKDGALVPAELEQHRNLSLSTRSPTYAVRVVNNDSRLVRLERAAGLAFPDKGFSLSGRLNPVPVLAATDKVLDLTLDGKDRATLSLADPVAANDLDKIRTAIESAAAAAGIAARIAIARANALGVADAAGEFLKITSQDTTEKSAVNVSPSSSGDLAAKTQARPCQRRTRERRRQHAAPRTHRHDGRRFGEILGTNVEGGMTITINDNSTGAPVALIARQRNLRPLPPVRRCAMRFKP